MVKKVDLSAQARQLVDSRREGVRTENTAEKTESQDFTRITTIVRKDYMKKIKIMASLEDKNIKDILDAILEKAIGEYEEANGAIVTK